MFLESRILIIDDQKRYLDLKKIFGEHTFSKCEDKGEYIECLMIYAVINGGRFNNKMIEDGKQVVEFQRQDTVSQVCTIRDGIFRCCLYRNE